MTIIQGQTALTNCFNKLFPYKRMNFRSFRPKLVHFKLCYDSWTFVAPRSITQICHAGEERENIPPLSKRNGFNKRNPWASSLKLQIRNYVPVTLSQLVKRIQQNIFVWKTGYVYVKLLLYESVKFYSFDPRRRRRLEKKLKRGENG